MRTHPTASSPQKRRWLRSATALALPATTLALVGFGAPAQAANPAEDCVLSGDAFSCSLVYTATGAEQTLLVPDGVTTITVEAVGASGGAPGGSTGGRGAVVSGSVAVTPGATYFVEVGGAGFGGGAGFNGGGSPTGDQSTNGGGGATDLRSVTRSDAATLASRILVAGGGGGADVSGSNGGNAGLDGASGASGSGATGTPGQGGTQTSGGAGGTTGATAGALGDGGNGGYQFGGGGGGGLYGGGGGGGSSTGVGNGGGGGSSLVPTGGSVAVNTANAPARLTVTYSSPVTDADLQLGASSVAAGIANPVTMSVTDGSVTAEVTPQSLTIAPNGPGTGATCTATACSATQIGTYTVTGTYAGFSRTRTFSVVAGPAATIELTPADSSATAGTQVTYTVTGTDTFGNDLGDITDDSLVTTSGPGGDNVACPQGVCHVEVAGDYVVSASTSGAQGVAVVDTAALEVVPAALARLVVSPDNAVVSVGQDRAYTVVGKDLYGNDLGDVTAQASVSFAPVDGGAATACAAATCRPMTAGVFRVTAQVGGVTGTAALTASANATTVKVTPVSDVTFGEDVPVSATVTSASGPVGGTVQFSLDGTSLGAPVALDSTGSASLPDVAGVHAGLHTLRASYVSSDGAFANGVDVAAFLVAKAPTTTTVTAAPGTLTAAVTGAGDPAGSVRFFIDGVEVGTAPLVDGTAVLVGTSNDGGSVVGAAYDGDADHEASATSTSRSNPVVTTRVSGKGGPTWYSGPVTVTFQCGSDVNACPAPAVLSKEGAGQYVTRTVTGNDGGVSVVTAGPINIDLTAPTAAFSRVSDGRTYKGRARIAQCQGADALSGLESCKVTTTGGPFGSITATATSTDAAGNIATTSATYDVLDVWVARSKRDGSTWSVRRGKRSNLHVMSTKAPRLRDSGAVRASGFKMVGRHGDITHWVASIRTDASAKPNRTVRLKVVSSEGTGTVRLRLTR